MKFYITRTSDWTFYSVIEAEHLEDCIRQLQQYESEFVVSILTEYVKANTIASDPYFNSLEFDEDGNSKIVHDEKRAEAYRSCDFEVEIYDDYREGGYGDDH